MKMKFNLKKQLASLVSATVMLTSAVVPAFAANAYFEDIASEVAYVYNYVDVADKSAVLSAKAKLNNLTEPQVSDGDVSTLLTDAFVNKFDSRQEAKASLIKLLTASLGTYFSNDEADLAGALTAADEKILTILEKGFGLGTANQWFDLFLRTKKDAQELSTNKDKMVWALGSTDGNTDSLTELYDTMDALQIKAMKLRLDEADYADVKDSFALVGWTSENLVAVCRNLMAYADPSHVGEFALIKAAARSSAELFDDGSSFEKIVRLAPNSGKAFKLSLEVLDWNVTNLVGFSTTNEELIAFEPDQTEKLIYANVNDGKKGAADIILKRDPLGNNSGSDKDWIAKFTVIVANEIGVASNFNLNSETGVLTWTAAENAVKYSVEIYNGENKVSTVEVTDEKINFKEIADANGNGTYTVKVTALGDIPEEVGEAAEWSYSYTASLDTVGKPVWDDMKLTWTGVTGATQYEIVLYNGETYFKTLTVDAVVGANEKDLANELEGQNGTFYATVQAKGENGIVGGVSEKSDGKLIQKLYKVSGVVQLESAKKGTVRTSSAGIKVVLGNLETTTDEKGRYTFENVPDSDDYKTIEFSYKYYLMEREKVEFVNKEITVKDTVLLFGDFYPGGQIINYADLPFIIEKIGSSAQYAPEVFDADMDINEDGRIGIPDLTVVIRNYNKKTKSFK